MCKGSMPRDNGGLILSIEEKTDLLDKSPKCEKLIKPFIGSNEFINSECRFCLWITDMDRMFAESIPAICNRLQIVKKYRESSKAPSTKEYANRPHLFVQRTYINAPFIFIPEVSSERREYIPIGYMENGEVASNKAFSIYNAPLWLFSVLTSKMHNIWVRTIGGALETRLSYSSNLCYNNFPFPKISKEQKEQLTELAEEVLLTRENHTEMTLGEMYNPETMPNDLKEAHQALDIAVEQCYRTGPFTSDDERLEYLFKLYEKMTKKK